ncbi:MAG TPA: TMEM175 family protein, partial [Holophagaceae bacterium]|nr:TMEM175 family protein [Holophagaceae bacterium]
TRGRLEAFSDGVIAILITIMVLELRPPHGAALADMRPLVPKLLSYLLSFALVAIYWNNHHHMLHAVQRVNGRVLWANLHLLFWLSLVPFATAWMGENHFAPIPVALYGGSLFMPAIAYYVLTLALIRRHGPDSHLAVALGRDFKGKVSILAYAFGIAVACRLPWLAMALYVLVALMWLVPDRRIERVVEG